MPAIFTQKITRKIYVIVFSISPYSQTRIELLHHELNTNLPTVFKLSPLNTNVCCKPYTFYPNKYLNLFLLFNLYLLQN